MPDLLETLTKTLSGSALQQISSRIGADEGSTSNAIAGALPILMGALDRNSDKPGGAEALLGALSRDHDGGILDNLSGLLGDSGGGAGEAILGHVLGGKRKSVETGLGRASGLDAGAVAKLLPILAPVVMGMLGREQRKKGLDARGLSDLLTGQRQQAEERDPDAMGVLGNLLDTNDDGQVVDDVVKLGSSLLGGLFGGRK